jgi:dolichol kinase
MPKSSLALELRRQTIHAAGILTLIPMYLLPRDQTTLLLGAMVLGILSLTIYRGHRTRLHKHIAIEQLFLFENWFEKQIMKFERPGEFPLRGALLFYVGVFVAFELFPMSIAAAATAVLAAGDSVSTVVGRSWGRHKLPINSDKSWEGSAAFFVGALFVLTFFVNPVKALMVAVAATAVEAAPWMDDNLTIPLATGLALLLLG